MQARLLAEGLGLVSCFVHAELAVPETGPEVDSVVPVLVFVFVTAV